MIEALKMSKDQTSKASRSAISSRALASGPTPLERLDGQMILPCGPARAHAKVSVQAGNGAASQISVTYGLHGSGSLRSAALTQSLANKLRAKTDLLGSMLFRLTWKERVTPSGRRIYALRASARRTSGNDYFSWATPATRDLTGATEDYNRAGDSDGLRKMRQLAAWATPQKMDAEKISTTPETEYARINRNPNMSSQIQSCAIQARLTNWQTPTVQDAASRDRHNQRDGTVILSMLGEARLANWTTPSATDGERSGTMTEAMSGSSLTQRARLTDSGETPNGSTAATANSGQLNPGTPVLASGIANRVGKLRGYGNALCAPVAQAFIEAAIEALSEVVSR